jgi:hypothetical protein
MDLEFVRYLRDSLEQANRRLAVNCEDDGFTKQFVYGQIRTLERVLQQYTGMNCVQDAMEFVNAIE